LGLDTASEIGWPESLGLPNLNGDNRPPQISGSPPPSAQQSASFSFTPAASDPDGDRLAFRVGNAPSWADFDTQTGTLSGNPGAADLGMYYDITIQVTDGFLSDVLVFDLEVVTSNLTAGSTTLNWTTPAENEDGSPLLDLAGFNIYYGAARGEYSTVIAVDNPGINSYVVDGLAPGTYHFATTAFTATGAESDYSNVVTRQVN